MEGGLGLVSSKAAVQASDIIIRIVVVVFTATVTVVLFQFPKRLVV